MSSDRTPGKWFDLGGGSADPAPTQSANRFPSMPNINIPGMRRQEVRCNPFEYNFKLTN